MTFRKLLPTLLFSLLLLVPTLPGKAPLLSPKALASPPPRIIRPCCSFGVDMRMMGIPGVRISDLADPQKLGRHHYLGDAAEGNGIVYTRRGGFIDLGHLRDMADWTAYLFTRIEAVAQGDSTTVALGYEGGRKLLQLHLPEDMTPGDQMLLAGKIAYDLSAWHEIATWYGTSLIPLIPERFSSFSVEDAYSNLLGVWLGMQALQSELPYEEAMTQLIAQSLEDLEVLPTQGEVLAAMESVRNHWWTADKALPSRKVLLQRQVRLYPELTPWLVPGWPARQPASAQLNVPQYSHSGHPLTDWYELEIKLNFKFPYKRIFPGRKGRMITQEDFPIMIAAVQEELAAAGFRFQ